MRRYAGLFMIAILAAILAIGAGVFVAYQLIFPPSWHEKLPMLNTTGQEIVITDYRNVTDPTYENLTKFLAGDDTETYDYLMPDHTCADFAVRLHDDAEAQGIRCGVVSVILNTTGYEGVWSGVNNSLYLDPYFGDSPDRGHAFNVFNTTDQGLVYVDSTGISASARAKGNSPHDMVAYVVEGKELGELWVSQAQQRLDYQFYEQRKGQYHTFSQLTMAFNKDVRDYNDRVNLFNFTYGEYERNVTAYTQEFDRYSSQLDDFNAKVDAYNGAMAAYNTEVQRYNAELAQHAHDAAYFANWSIALEKQKASIPPLPFGGEELERWRLSLLDRVGELEQQGKDLQQRQLALDMQRDALILRKKALMDSDEAGWVIGRPMGIVEHVSVYW